MKQSTRQTELAAYHAELAREWNARRCACGAPVDVVLVEVGRNAVREAGMMLKKNVPDRNYCLACAGMTGTVDASVDRSQV